jgi:hypothetical protein
LLAFLLAYTPLLPLAFQAFRAFRAFIGPSIRPLVEFAHMVAWGL